MQTAGRCLKKGCCKPTSAFALLKSHATGIKPHETSDRDRCNICNCLPRQREMRVSKKGGGQRVWAELMHLYLRLIVKLKSLQKSAMFCEQSIDVLSGRTCEMSLCGCLAGGLATQLAE